MAALLSLGGSDYPSEHSRVLRREIGSKAAP